MLFSLGREGTAALDRDLARLTIERLPAGLPQRWFKAELGFQQLVASKAPGP